MQYDQHVWDWAEYHSDHEQNDFPEFVITQAAHEDLEQRLVRMQTTPISQGTKLPARVINWAKQHDWFHSSTPDGVLTVFDRYTLHGEHHEYVCVWNDTAQELAAWAGY